MRNIPTKDIIDLIQLSLEVASRRAWVDHLFGSPNTKQNDLLASLRTMKNDEEALRKRVLNICEAIK